MHSIPKKSLSWTLALLLLVVAYSLLPSGRNEQYSTAQAASLSGAIANAPEVDPVIVGAGDIADCGVTGDEATAALLDTIEGTVITLGDNVYEDGTLAEFINCYEPTWGRHKARTRPSAGNHDYHIPGAEGYYSYFGALAGDPTRGYYSYVLDTWLIVVLNSNCSAVGGCQSGTSQETWLRNELAANPDKNAPSTRGPPKASPATARHAGCCVKRQTGRSAGTGRL